MSWLYLPVAFIFAIAGLICVLLVAIGLPGVWLMLLFALVIELADGLYLAPERQPTFSWGVLLAALLLAIAGELLEFIASALGAKHGGASRRGMIASVVGAMLGGIAGTVLLPIPVVGSIAGAVAGAAGGAMLGEISREGATLRDTLKPAQGAAIGRLLGTLGKLPCAAAAWVVLVVAAFRP